MASISFLIYIQRETGTFSEAGAVSGSALAGLAFGSVLQGKLIDRWGPTRALAGVMGVFAFVAGACFLAVDAHLAVQYLIVAAFAFGLTQPSISSASRGLWGRLAPAGRIREAAYTYEAISLEIFFILGPALAGILATMPWAGTGLAVTVVLFLVGTTLFIVMPAVRRWRRDHAEEMTVDGMFHLVKIPGMQTLIMLVFGFGVTIGFSEVAIPAAATDAGRPELSGVLLGVWALAGVLFGVVYATKPWPASLHQRSPALLAGFAVLVGLMALASNLATLAIAMVISGTLITPQSTTHSLLVEEVAPPHASAEAFGWVLTGATLGVGTGQVLSGQLVAIADPSAAMAAAVIPGVLMSLIVWLRRNTLRGPNQPMIAE